MGQVNRLTGQVTQTQDQTLVTAKSASQTAAALVSSFYDNLGPGMPKETKRALTEQFSAPLFAGIGVAFEHGLQKGINGG